MQRREEGYAGKRVMETAVPGRRERGTPRRQWMDLAEKTWKGLELRRETKLVGSNGKYFHAVVTPYWEKSKEEDGSFIELCTTKV